MAELNRITIDAGVLNGVPCIRHMRLSVKRVLESLAVIPDWQDLIAEYPGLEEEDISQAIALVAHTKEVFDLPFRDTAEPMKFK